MYLNFFGLNKDPFRITPDPEFFFSGGNRGAVLEALCYAVAKGEGIVKVVGEVGSGKTMLCRMLERELPGNCEIIYLANPRLNADEVLFAIAHELQLNLPSGASKLEALAALQKYLLEKHANNRRVVMFIEEAQGMHIDSLEEVRMLSNLETTQEKLLQIVLFGQPEFDQKLSLHEIRQLKERITYSFNLAPLNRVEIRDYLYTRLTASGYRGNELFAKRAIALLSKHSEGLLRRINVLADKALLAAFSQGAHKVDRKHVKMAIADSDFARPPMRLVPIFGAGILVLVTGTLTWWLSSQENLVTSTELANQVELISPELEKTLAADSRDAAAISNVGAEPADRPVESMEKVELEAPTTTEAAQADDAIAEGLPLSAVKTLSKSRDNPENAAKSPEKSAIHSNNEFKMFEALRFDTSVVSIQ